MSEENGKVCCNCWHNIRHRDIHDQVMCICEVDDHYIGYMECMEGWCRHWASDEKKWKEVEE